MIVNFLYTCWAARVTQLWNEVLCSPSVPQDKRWIQPLTPVFTSGFHLLSLFISFLSLPPAPYIVNVKFHSKEILCHFATWLSDCVTAEKQTSLCFSYETWSKRADKMHEVKSKSCAEVELSYVDLCVKVKRTISIFLENTSVIPRQQENSTAECLCGMRLQLTWSDQHSGFPFQFQNREKLTLLSLCPSPVESTAHSPRVWSATWINDQTVICSVSILIV